MMGIRKRKQLFARKAHVALLGLPRVSCGPNGHWRMAAPVPQADGHSFLMVCPAFSSPGFSLPGDESGHSDPTPVLSM